jgi:hypothetical protein
VELLGCEVVRLLGCEVARCGVGNKFNLKTEMTYIVT